jgi:hypothetical protein
MDYLKKKGTAVVNLTSPPLLLSCIPRLARRIPRRIRQSDSGRYWQHGKEPSEQSSAIGWLFLDLPNAWLWNDRLVDALATCLGIGNFSSQAMKVRPSSDKW